MPFDPVHDIQKVFRKTVEAFSYPGRVIDLSPQADRLDFESVNCPKAMLALGWMLLDADTTFSCREAEAARLLSLLSFARQRPCAEAQFVFTDGLAPEFLGDLEAAMAGDLIDPHQSATVIAAAGLDGEGREYLLEGPGIESELRCRIGLAEGWRELRAERNREFPMGVDLILVDGQNRLMALPRTTLVREVG
jgi:alpha-D-ribose 1-methylphosphonate 5-triphosphate synthase subunit PhnH